MFKSHLVVQIWTIIYVEYVVNIDQKIGQKIQVKAKFPQAVFTNLRTLPPVFPKMFWTTAWWKIPDGCFWHYLCKTIYSCSKKVALSVFTEMCSTTFFMEIKRSYNQRNSVGTDRENVIPGNLIVIWKLNETWPLKKNSYAHFLTALKVFKTQRELHHFLTALKVFNTEKKTPLLSYDS